MKYEKELPQRHFDVFGFVLRRLEVEKLSSKNSEISTPKVPTTFLPRVPRTFLQTPIDVLGASSISNLSKDFVTQFLREHQAMGIYLYSEMASSTNSTVNKLAKKTFQDLSPELDPSTKHNISELLPS